MLDGLLVYVMQIVFFSMCWLLIDMDIQTKMKKFPIILSIVTSHTASLPDYFLLESYALEVPELGLPPYIDGLFKW